MQASTSYTQLNATIQAAGLGGSIVCLHSSLKSFGYLEGGADALIRAFLDSGCTLLVPAFYYASEAPPPPGRQIPQNGFDDPTPASPATGEYYDPSSTMISPDMGAIPARLLQMEGCARGIHPLNSFAAIGPFAEELIRAQTLLDVYGPLKAIYNHAAAYMVLAGVDLTKATPIHLAEEMAGRRLFRQWAWDKDGAVLEVAIGSCSEGFNRFAPLIADLETNLPVGKSLWRIYPFQAFIDRVTENIARDQTITHCGDVTCTRCNDAVRGGPLL